MNRRLMTILVPLAAATLTAGCTSFADPDTVASVGDTELSSAELDRLLTDRQFSEEERQDLDLVRQVISGWIESTAIDNGLFSPEAIAAIPDEELISLYGQGLAVSGVTCVRLIVAADLEAGDAAADRLREGEDFATVFDEVNIDADLATVNGEAGCFDRNQFAELPELSPEIEALFELDETEPFASAETLTADGSQGALVLAFRAPGDLPEQELAQILELIRQTSAAGLVIDAIDIDVASRYGTFDAATASVVPLG